MSRFPYRFDKNFNKEDIIDSFCVTTVKHEENTTQTLIAEGN